MELVDNMTFFLALLLVVAVPYWQRVVRQRNKAMQIWEKNTKAGMHGPVTLHPHINTLDCIGCASCVRVCPEGALGIVNGRSALVGPTKCIGHSLCVDVCPTDAITMGFGAPKQGMEIPYYDETNQSNIEGLYIVGELGGIGLIRNAIGQSLKAIDDIVRKNRKRPAQGCDVVIVGAGPAGIAAALACQAKNLRYVVLEQDAIGSTVLHYPRKKLVLTEPVHLPLYGKLKMSEISKEELLRIWEEIVGRFRLNILTQHKVESTEKVNDLFVTISKGRSFLSSGVLLAIGRRGSPRKLGVPGETLPKVMYRLIEAETYNHKNVLVVGGGDSAIEAAVGLANQEGNTVTVSYRRDAFVRLKEKNEERVQALMKSGKLKVIFNSHVRQITPDGVVIQDEKNIVHNLPNDFVFIFAGGELPTELLKKTGVKLRTNEVHEKAA